MTKDFFLSFWRFTVWRSVSDFEVCFDILHIEVVKVLSRPGLTHLTVDNESFSNAFVFFRGFCFDCVNRSLHELKFSDGERWFIMIIFIITNIIPAVTKSSSSHHYDHCSEWTWFKSGGKYTHRWQRSAACALTYQIFQKASLFSVGFVIFES